MSTPWYRQSPEEQVLETIAPIRRSRPQSLPEQVISGGEWTLGALANLAAKSVYMPIAKSVAGAQGDVFAQARLRQLENSGRPIYGSEILRSFGIGEVSDDAEWYKKLGSFGLGLAVDVVSDPLTYIPFGALTKVGRARQALSSARLLGTEVQEGSRVGKLIREAGNIGKDVPLNVESTTGRAINPAVSSAIGESSQGKPLWEQILAGDRNLASLELPGGNEVNLVPRKLGAAIAKPFSMINRINLVTRLDKSVRNLFSNSTKSPEFDALYNAYREATNYAISSRLQDAAGFRKRIESLAEMTGASRETVEASVMGLVNEQTKNMGARAFGAVRKGFQKLKPKKFTVDKLSPEEEIIAGGEQALSKLPEFELGWDTKTNIYRTDTLPEGWRQVTEAEMRTLPPGYPKMQVMGKPGLFVQDKPIRWEDFTNTGNLKAVPDTELSEGLKTLDTEVSRRMAELSNVIRHPSWLSGEAGDNVLNRLNQAITYITDEQTRRTVASEKLAGIPKLLEDLNFWKKAYSGDPGNVQLRGRIAQLLGTVKIISEKQNQAVLDAIEKRVSPVGAKAVMDKEAIEEEARKARFQRAFSRDPGRVELRLRMYDVFKKGRAFLLGPYAKAYLNQMLESPRMEEDFPDLFKFFTGANGKRDLENWIPDPTGRGEILVGFRSPEEIIKTKLTELEKFETESLKVRDWYRPPSPKEPLEQVEGTPAEQSDWYYDMLNQLITRKSLVKEKGLHLTRPNSVDTDPLIKVAKRWQDDLSILIQHYVSPLEKEANPEEWDILTKPLTRDEVDLIAQRSLDEQEMNLASKIRFGKKLTYLEQESMIAGVEKTLGMELSEASRRNWSRKLASVADLGRTKLKPRAAGEVPVTSKDLWEVAGESGVDFDLKDTQLFLEDAARKYYHATNWIKEHFPILRHGEVVPGEDVMGSDLGRISTPVKKVVKSRKSDLGMPTTSVYRGTPVTTDDMRRMLSLMYLGSKETETLLRKGVENLSLKEIESLGPLTERAWKGARRLIRYAEEHDIPIEEDVMRGLKGLPTPDDPTHYIPPSVAQAPGVPTYRDVHPSADPVAVMQALHEDLATDVRRTLNQQRQIAAESSTRIPNLLSNPTFLKKATSPEARNLMLEGLKKQGKLAGMRQKDVDRFLIRQMRREFSKVNQEGLLALVGEGKPIDAATYARARGKDGVAVLEELLKSGRLTREQFDSAVYQMSVTEANQLARTRGLSLLGTKEIVDPKTGKTVKTLRTVDQFFHEDPAFITATQGIQAERAIGETEFFKKLVTPTPDAQGNLAYKIGVPVEEAPPNFRAVKNPALSGYVFEPTVANVLDRHYKIKEPGDWDGFLKLYDNIQNTWKAWTLGIFPAYHIRNFVGNIWNNWLAGVVNPNDYRKAYLLARGYEAGDIISGTGIKYTSEEIRSLASRFGVLNKGLQGAEVDRDLNQILSSGRIFSLSDNKMVRLGQKVGTSVENNARLAHFIAKIQEGMSPAEAALSVKKFLFDYSDITDAERAVMKRLFPFYTWFRKNVPLQLQMLAQSPWKYGTIYKTSQNLSDVLGGPAPDERYLPQWMKENFPTRIRYNHDTGKYDYFLFNTWLPAADIIKLSDLHNTVVNMSAPIPKEIIQQLWNYDFFMKRKIEEIGFGQQWDTLHVPFAQLPVPTRLLHAGKVVRLLNEMDKMNNPDNDLLSRWMDFISGKTQTYDPQRGMIQNKFRVDEEMQTLKIILKRSMRQGNQTDVNRILGLMQEKAQEY